MLPFHVFTHPLSPRSGDARTSRFMEELFGSSGPAHAAAIAALPKKPIEESMLGPDGSAECTICIENVSVGDEVTVMPCSHWFHGKCVVTWLKEHDTCPHCRQSISSKENGQRPPRNSQPPVGHQRRTSVQTSSRQAQPLSLLLRHESRRPAGRNGGEPTSIGRRWWPNWRRIRLGPKFRRTASSTSF